MPKPAPSALLVSPRDSSTDSAKAMLRELEKGARPVRQPAPARRQPVLFFGAHLAEGAVAAVGEKNRIVAKATAAARRPDDGAVDAARERLRHAVRPCEAERRHEGRAPSVQRRRSLCLELLLDDPHRLAEILLFAGPARRIDAGLAAERCDDEAGVIR